MADMDDKTKRELHRVIAGGRLSRPEMEVMRDRVLDEIERKEGRGKGGEREKEQEQEKRSGAEARSGRARVIRVAYWGSAVVAAAAAVLLMVRGPGEPGGEVHQEESGRVSSRPVIEVTCRGGTLSACPRGAEIVFAIAGKGVEGFLSAYAEPIGREGERVFYFSTEDGSAKIATDTSGAGVRVAERAMRIPDAQRAGRYRVHAYLAQRALGRDEMQSALGRAVVLANSRVEVVITE